MNDTYQAVFDAVRSKIGGCDVDDAIHMAVRESMDISWAMQFIQQEFVNAAHEMMRPVVLLKPRFFIDGNLWCALYGENLQDGIAGFGKTPADAAHDFDREFNGWNDKKSTTTRGVSN